MMIKKINLPKERAGRIKFIREGLVLSRQKFANLLGLTKSTVQNWEEARAYGLTEHGAKQMVAGLTKLNVQTTFEWLMAGTGMPPVFPKDTFNKGRWRNCLQKPPVTKKLSSKNCCCFNSTPRAALIYSLQTMTCFLFMELGTLWQGNAILGTTL